MTLRNEKDDASHLYDLQDDGYEDPNALSNLMALYSNDKKPALEFMSSYTKPGYPFKTKRKRSELELEIKPNHKYETKILSAPKLHKKENNLFDSNSNSLEKTRPASQVNCLLMSGIKKNEKTEPRSNIIECTALRDAEEVTRASSGLEDTFCQKPLKKIT